MTEGRKRHLLFKRHGMPPPAFSDEFPLLASFSGIIRGWRRGGSGASPSNGRGTRPLRRYLQTSRLASSSGLTRGSRPHAAAIPHPRSHRTFSPPPPSMPTISPSRRGYTARRRGEAGSARGVGGRRRTPCTGPAENGLPPATRGKRRALDRAFRFTPRTARRACLCGTQGGRSGGCVGIVRRDEARPERLAFPSAIAKARDDGCKNGKRRHPGNRRETSARPGLCREAQVAGKNRRTGR